MGDGGLVAVRGEVDLQRPGQRPVVVDDQHAGHPTCLRPPCPRRSAPAPPSSARRPECRPRRRWHRRPARGHGRPRARGPPRRRRDVTESLERLEHSRSSAGDARTAVGDPDLDAPAAPRLAQQPHGRHPESAAVRCRSCSRTPARAGPVGVEQRQVVGDLVDDAVGRIPISARCSTSSTDTRARGAIAPACSLLMSSRFSSSCPAGPPPLHTTPAARPIGRSQRSRVPQARHRRLDRRQRRAQVVRQRGEHRGAQRVAAAAIPPARRPCAGARSAAATACPATTASTRSPAVSCRPRNASSPRSIPTSTSASSGIGHRAVSHRRTRPTRPPDSWPVLWQQRDGGHAERLAPARAPRRRWPARPRAATAANSCASDRPRSASRPGPRRSTIAATDTPTRNEPPGPARSGRWRW